MTTKLSRQKVSEQKSLDSTSTRTKLHFLTGLWTKATPAIWTACFKLFFRLDNCERLSTRCGQLKMKSSLVCREFSTICRLVKRPYAHQSCSRLSVGIDIKEICSRMLANFGCCSLTALKRKWRVQQMKEHWTWCSKVKSNRWSNAPT